MTLSKSEAAAIEEAVKQQSNKGMVIDQNKIFMAIILGAGVFLWDMQSRITLVERNIEVTQDELQKSTKITEDQLKGTTTDIKEILLSIRNIETTRVKPEDFRQQLTPLQIRIDELSRSDKSQQLQLTELGRSLEKLKLGLQRLSLQGDK